jgi:hypothetical protein
MIDMTQSVRTMDQLERVINSLLAKPCGEDQKVYRVFIKSIPAYNSEIFDTLLSICSNLSPLDRQNLRNKGGLSINSCGFIVMMYLYGRRKKGMELSPDVHIVLDIVSG